MNAPGGSSVEPTPKTPTRWTFPKRDVVHGVFGHSTWCGRYREKGDAPDDGVEITCERCLAIGGT